MAKNSSASDHNEGQEPASTYKMRGSHESEFDRLVSSIAQLTPKEQQQLLHEIEKMFEGSSLLSLGGILHTKKGKKATDKKLEEGIKKGAIDRLKRHNNDMTIRK